MGPVDSFPTFCIIIMKFDSTYMLNSTRQSYCVCYCQYTDLHIYFSSGPHCFLNFHVSIWDHLPSDWRTSFNVAFSASFLVTNTFFLFLFCYHLYRIFSLEVEFSLLFSFSTLKISFHCLQIPQFCWEICY